MKKKILALGLAIAMFTMTGISSYAGDGAAVSFTAGNTLKYSGVTVQDGVVNIGSAFENVAPGETRTQTITVKNDNSRTADFYMSAEAVKALETNTAAAKGAGYEITLTAGGNTLYDSTLGGYNAGESASTLGISGMNSALEDYIMIGTMKQGESMDVVLTIMFDGEAMDNMGAVDYSLTDGQLAFDFQVGYEDPTGTTVIVREVSGDGQVRYIRKVVEILEGAVPLGAVATGDGAMFGVAAIVLAAGAFLIFAGRRKKTEEEA